MEDEFNILIPTSHPFEEEVERELRRLVERHQWPIERAGLSVSFVLRQSEASSSDVSQFKAIEQGQATGWVKLYFNHLFLVQNPGVFIRQIVPHEMAHAWTKARCVANKEKPHNRHDNVYIARHQSLTQQPIKEHGELMSMFDSRPLRLVSNGQPARCSCRGDTGFWVLKSTEAKNLAREPIKCPRCLRPVSIVDDTKVPEGIREQCAYIHWWKSNGKPS